MNCLHIVNKSNLLKKNVKKDSISINYIANSLQLKGNFSQVKKLRLGWKFLPQKVENSNYTFIYSEKWIRSGGQ